MSWSIERVDINNYVHERAEKILVLKQEFSANFGILVPYERRIQTSLSSPSFRR